MKETPQEEIIALAYEYKEGKVSKTMLNKYIECTFNWAMFEASNMEGIECLDYTILFGMANFQAFMIIRKPKPRKPLPKFESGCIHGEGEEMIINSKGVNILHAKTPTLDDLKKGNGNSISFNIK